MQLEISSMSASFTSRLISKHVSETCDTAQRSEQEMQPHLKVRLKQGCFALRKMKHAVYFRSHLFRLSNTAAFARLRLLFLTWVLRDSTSTIDDSHLANDSSDPDLQGCEQRFSYEKISDGTKSHLQGCVRLFALSSELVYRSRLRELQIFASRVTCVTGKTWGTGHTKMLVYFKQPSEQ